MNAVEQWTRTRYERPIAVRRTISEVYHRRHTHPWGLPTTNKHVGFEYLWRVQCRICSKWLPGHRQHAAALADADVHLKSHGGAPYRQLRAERDQLRRWALDQESDVEDYRQAASHRNEQINDLRHALSELLARFTDKGHPGVASLRTSWVRATYIDTLRTRLKEGKL